MIHTPCFSFLYSIQSHFYMMSTLGHVWALKKLVNSCGFCGLSGCSIGIMGGSGRGKTANQVVSSNCDYKVKFSLKSVEKHTKYMPSSNRPMTCSLCKTKYIGGRRSMVIILQMSGRLEKRNSKAVKNCFLWTNEIGRTPCCAEIIVSQQGYIPKFSMAFSTFAKWCSIQVKSGHKPNIPFSLLSS